MTDLRWWLRFIVQEAIEYGPIAVWNAFALFGLLFAVTHILAAIGCLVIP